MDNEKKEKRKNPVIGYFSSAIAELHKVSWPSRDEVTKKTRTVVFFSLIFAVFLGSLDFALNNLIQFLLK